MPPRVSRAVSAALAAAIPSAAQAPQATAVAGSPWACRQAANASRYAFAAA
ncbi:hypothetical protein B0E53_06902 [Micromonospora sp. MH33]|nr:hypothetical protein B0E53_06902 [Micromonospora sp. MH33]